MRNHAGRNVTARGDTRLHTLKGRPEANARRTRRQSRTRPMGQIAPLPFPDWMCSCGTPNNSAAELLRHMDICQDWAPKRRIICSGARLVEKYRLGRGPKRCKKD